MSEEKTTVQVTKQTAERLQKIKNFGESYDTVINKLIEKKPRFDRNLLK